MDDVMQEVAPIGVVQGASSVEIQAMLAELVREWRADLRIAGVLENDYDPEECGGEAFLCSITDGARFPIFQDLGSGSQACSLDARGITMASAAVERDIAAGCDLVVLSKFGKLEVGREGLMGAYQAAFDAGIPILTAVSPNWQSAWESFAGQHFAYLPADLDALRAWRRALKAAPQPAL